jgi:hypothetical protein
MTQAWAPVDAEFYFEEVAPYVVKPWTERAAVHHLRFCVNEMHREKPRPWPSRAELSRLWGWSDRKVRALLARDDEWRIHLAIAPVDREQLRPPRAPGTDRRRRRPAIQVATESRPSAIQVETEQRRESAETDPSAIQVRSESRPSRDPLLNQKNHPTKHNGVGHGPTPEAVWRVLLERCPDCPPGREVLGADNRKSIARILADGWKPDDVVAVWRWRCTSPHKRAAYLRDGGYAWSTLAVKFGEYHALAQPARAGPGPPKPWDEDALYREAKRRNPCPNPDDDEVRSAWIDKLTREVLPQIREDIAAGRLPAKPP